MSLINGLYRNYREYLLSEEWISRSNAFKSNLLNKKCNICRTDKHLIVHHKTYINIGNESFKDLILLCRDCHKNVHDFSEKFGCVVFLFEKYYPIWRRHNLLEKGNIQVFHEFSHLGFVNVFSESYFENKKWCFE